MTQHVHGMFGLDVTQSLDERPVSFPRFHPGGDGHHHTVVVDAERLPGLLPRIALVASERHRIAAEHVRLRK